MTKIPRALTIAGSDSGGGAGIQADLKTFAAHRVYGMAVITSVTAQDTMRVRSYFNLPTTLIEEQIDAVLGDIGADAMKTGMLASRAIVETVGRCVRRWRVKHLVVDPVMVSKAGDSLMDSRAHRTLVEVLFPLAELITPNIPEAEKLIGRPLVTRVDVEAAGRELLEMGPRAVLIKGGHTKDLKVVTDWLFMGSRVIKFSSPRVRTRHTHGTGCTLSAAITANLARGYELVTACRRAKKFVSGAVRKALPLGHGHGPLNHTWEL